MEGGFDLEVEKEKINKYMRVLSLSFFLMFVFVFIVGLGILVPDLVLGGDASNISNLGDFGSYLNVIISIASTITVGLVFYGVRMQSLEFRAARIQIKQQIDLADKKSKEDREINFYSEWLELGNTSPETNFIQSINMGVTDREKKYISRIVKMYEQNKLKEVVDMELLVALILNEDIYERMMNEFQKNVFYINKLKNLEVSTFPPLKAEDYLQLASFLPPNKIETQEVANAFLDIFLLDKNLRTLEKIRSNNF